jgi:hypothetical protein
MTTAPRSSALVRYPFPLADGVIAYLDLPHPLTRDDIRRIAALLETLVPVTP